MLRHKIVIIKITSNVIDMSGMFAMSSFNQPVGNWNVGNVTNMRLMFYKTTLFNQDISSWNVSKVIHHDNFSKNSPLQEDYKPHFQ